MKSTERTLLEQMHFDQEELAQRRRLLDLNRDDDERLGRCREYVVTFVDDLVARLYKRMTEDAEMDRLIGDADTFRRLHGTMRRYILELFDGRYGLEYVNNRLHVGLVHSRFGVAPKLYLATLRYVRELLGEYLREVSGQPLTDKATLVSLDKQLFFDTQLIFDTYVHGLVRELEYSRSRVTEYARQLEDKVAERTRELKEQSRRDPLTGLYNRLALFEQLTRDLARAERTGQPLCLVYIDVNNFKGINDTFGHQEGDRVLRLIADILRGAARDSDFVCRYGGDEFCALLPDTSAERAAIFCDRATAELKKADNRVSLSMGTAQTGPAEYDDSDRLISRADHLMYEAKRSGPIAAINT